MLYKIIDSQVPRIRMWTFGKVVILSAPTTLIPWWNRDRQKWMKIEGYSSGLRETSWEFKSWQWWYSWRDLIKFVRYLHCICIWYGCRSRKKEEWRVSLRILTSEFVWMVVISAELGNTGDRDGLCLILSVSESFLWLLHIQSPLFTILLSAPGG